MTSQFTPKVSEILAFSREEASRLASHSVGPEHLLLGLMRSREGRVLSVFQRLNVNLQSVKTELENRVREDEIGMPITTSELVLNEKASNILKLAVLEARIQRTTRVDEQHLLLAILHDRVENGAKQVLEMNNMNYEDVLTLLSVKDGVKDTVKDGIGLPDEDYEEEEGRRRLLIPIVVVVCLVAAAVGLWLAFFSGVFDRAEMVEVPNLLGRTLTEVYEDPKVMDNFQVNRVSTEFSDEYKEGEIISQDPAAEQSAEKGSTINVVVSGGQEYLEMIDVTDMSYDKAAAQLESMGLVVEEPEYEYSDDVAEGNVISASPVAGEPILPGDSVHLVVSLGVEVKMVRVPNVTGNTLESARVTLTSQGLTIAGITEVTNDRPQGQVIYQSIPANTEVEEGTSLTLQVSKGPEKQEEPQTEKTVVPTVTGQSLESARSLLSGAELHVSSVSEVESDAPAGQVVYQSIPAGTSVDEGTGVSLQVSKGPAEPIEEPEEPEL